MIELMSLMLYYDFFKEIKDITIQLVFKVLVCLNIKDSLFGMIVGF